MREIGFRCWDKSNEEWVYETVSSICQAIYYNDTSASNLPNSSCNDDLPEIFCQFTGLKDKNGKEIYEGDIFNLGDKNILYVVEHMGCCLLGRQLDNQSRVGIDYWKDTIEIIGNIYENPELLEPLLGNNAEPIRNLPEDDRREDR